MKVEVKLFATLARFLPQTATAGAVTVEFPEGTSVAGLIATLGIPADLPAIVLLNGRDAAPDQVLQDGDSFAMFPPLAGGQSGSSDPVDS